MQFFHKHIHINNLKKIIITKIFLYLFTLSAFVASPTHAQNIPVIVDEVMLNGFLNGFQNFPDNPNWDIAANNTDNWTVDFWVQHPFLPLGDEVYIQHFQNLENRWSMQHVKGEGLRFFLSKNGQVKIDISYDGAINDTAFHHIALVKVGNTYGIYKDGTQVLYAQDNDIGNLTGNLYLGSRDGSSQFFVGTMKTVRIHNSNHLGASPNANKTDIINPNGAPTPFCGDTQCNGSEDCSSCSQDCDACPLPSPTCGDGSCNEEETCSSCSQDCGSCPPPPPSCGDSSCNGSETCSSCSQDCGQCAPVCGDGTINGSEQCDDGNTQSGDGCSSSCITEFSSVCGNSTVESGEQCDDGNTTSGDGCSSNCVSETVPVILGNKNFNGVNDYQTFSDNPNWDIVANNSDAWTADFWVEHSHSSGDQVYLQHYQDNGNRWSLQHIETAGLRFFLASGGPAIIDISYNGEITDTNRHHIAFIKVGNEFGIYKDGMQVLYAQDNDTADLTGNLFVGARNGNAQFFAGKIEDLRIHNSNHFSGSPNSGITDTISIPGSVAPPPVPFCGDNQCNSSETCSTCSQDCGQCAPVCGDGVINGSEQCDDGNTISNDGCSSICMTEVNPVCGDGIINNSEQCDDGNTTNGDGCSSTCTVEGIPVLLTTASFNGFSDHIVSADSPTWDIVKSNTDHWTVDFFVKHRNVSGDQVYLQHYQNIGNRWSLQHVETGGLRFFLANGGPVTIDIAYAGEITDTNQHHIALIKVGNEFGIYKDGVQILYLQDNDVADLTGDLFVGSRNGIAQFFNGVMEDLRIHNSNHLSGSPNPGITDTILVPGTVPPVCGDGTCNNNETCSSCSQDCGACPPPPPICGDGICNGAETCSSCAGDCGTCPPTSVCGNNVTESGETCDGQTNVPCLNLGYSGTMNCLPNCSGFSACNTTEFCGDGTVQGLAGEVCDTNMQSCTTAFGYAGTQPCAVDCSGYLPCTSILFCGDTTCTNPPETTQSCFTDCPNVCGNGVLEFNEDCDDGNTVNGDGCSSTCTTESNSGDISPVVTPSRTNGVAPLAVSFNTTGTTHIDNSIDPFHDLHYDWNFNDPNSGVWSTNSRSKNTEMGPVAAHIFDTPGTYNVSVTIRDMNSETANHNMTITVDDPDTIFANNTTCVSRSGSFTGCPSGAKHVTNSSGDFRNTLTTELQSNTKRILFERGQNWSSNSAATITQNGPGLIGAYGSCVSPDAAGRCANAPNITKSSETGNIIESLGSGIRSDWRIMDLKISGPACNVPASGSGNCGNGIDALDVSKFLYYRIDANGFRVSAMINHFQGGSQDSAIVDSKLQNPAVDAGYAGGPGIMIMGNDMGNTQISHVLRIWHAQNSVISHNKFENPSTQSQNRIELKLHARGTGSLGTEKVVLRGNEFGGNTSWPVTVGATDNGTGRNQSFSDIIFDSNVFDTNKRMTNSPNPSTDFHLNVHASRATFRNNIFIADTGANKYTAIRAWKTGDSSLTISPNNFKVYNNVLYKGTASTEVKLFGGNPSNSEAMNNIVYAPNVTTPSIGPINTSHNVVTNNNPFTSSNPSVASDFQLASGANEIDTGTNVSALNDFSDKLRPLNNVFDLGAFEFDSNNPPPPIFCGDNLCNGSETCSSCSIDCGVCPPVCGNNIREAGEECDNNDLGGENCVSQGFDQGTLACTLQCTLDTSNCSLLPTPTCGDSSCNGSETCSTCSQDCGTCTPVCGNSTCNGSETCLTCSQDCGQCTPICGDSSCNGSETCSTCSQDCGVCPPPPPGTFPIQLTGPAPEENNFIFNISKPANVVTANIQMVIFDPDFADEGNLFINNNGPIALFGSQGTSSNDAQTLNVTFQSSSDWWVDGNNILLFQHTRTAGYNVESMTVSFVGAPPPPACGDGSCNGTEDCNSCAQDCGVCPPPPPTCGDETCNGTETCSSCSQDCGTCPPPPPSCGDGTCNGTETCSTCSQDCGVCPPPTSVCGNGISETGEQCDDGNTANGDGCDSQCLIEGNSGLILPMITTTRTTGVAPLGIVFEGRGTTHTNNSIDTFTDLFYKWNFGNPSAGTWSVGPDQSDDKNIEHGPIAAHVYERPGTYTVTMEVRDTQGNFSTKQQIITVQDPNTVFSGTNTTCASTSGNFTGCPSGANKVTTTSFNTATANCNAANRRCLFRAGESFTAGGRSFNFTGPTSVGVYDDNGESYTQKATVTGVSSNLVNYGGGNSSDHRLWGFNVPMGASGAAADFGNVGPSSLAPNRHNNLVHKVSTSGGNSAVRGWIKDLQYGNPTGLVVSEITGSNWSGGSGNVGLSLAGTQMAILAADLVNSRGIEHVGRIPFLRRSVIAHSRFEDSAVNKAVLKLHNTQTKKNGNWTEEVVVSNNLFVTGPVNGQAVTIEAQNSIENEPLRRIVFENNTADFRSSSSRDSKTVRFGASDSVMRNNVCFGADAKWCFVVTNRSTSGNPTNVQVYNNSCYGDATQQSANCVTVLGSGHTCNNNLSYSDGATMSLCSGAGNLVATTNPYISPNPTTKSDFKLNLTSQAIDTGVAVPVLFDIMGVSRPQEQGYDVGAHEFASGGIIIPPICGDGTCNGTETCSTCSTDCGVCPPPPPTCGDGTCNGSETCSSCSQDCGTCPPPSAICGNGQIETGEICELGNQQSCTTGGYAGTLSCLSDCSGFGGCITSESCGDGIVNGPEQCDDGNTANGDGCDSQCQTEAPPPPPPGSGTIYYISSSLGNDNWSGTLPEPSGTDGPKKSLGAASTLLNNAQPGQSVLLRRRDTWTSGGISLSTTAGTQANPITLGAYVGAGGSSSDPLPKIDLNQTNATTLFIRGASSTATSYLNVQNLHLTTSNPIGSRPSTAIQVIETFHPNRPHHITFSNMVVENHQYGISLQTTNNIIIENSTIRNNWRDKNVETGGHSQGIFASSPNIIIRNNVIQDNGAPGDGFDHNTYMSNCGNCLYENNTVSGHFSGLKIRGGNGMTVRGNTFFGSSFSTLTAGSDGGKTLSNATIENNTFYNTQYGMNIKEQSTGPSNIDNLTIRNNVIYNTSRQGILIHSTNITNSKVYNNTIHPSNGEALLFRSSMIPTNLSIKNNILANSSTKTLVQTEFNNFTQVDLNSNLYHTQLGNTHNINGTTYNTLSNFQTATNLESLGLEGDPSFVDVANNDFSITSSSIAIDAGVNLSGIVDEDINMNPRPAGSGWDIGAYESLVSPITPVVTPSRIIGVAPLFVNFDATNTTAPSATTPFHEVFFTWTFGDSAAGTWTYSGTSKNKADGPIAAHVFETPGTYTVTLNVTAPDGSTGTKNVTITVQDPNTVFSGTKTVCVSSSGNFTGCPTGATQVTSSSFGNVSTHAGPNKRILFKRGETFSGSTILDKSGPGLIGAYGAGSIKPIISASNSNGTLRLSRSNNTDWATDWRIVGLEFRNNLSGAAISTDGFVRQITVLDIKATVNMAGGMFIYYKKANLSGATTIHDQIAFVDSEVETANGNHRCATMGVKRSAILGNFCKSNPSSTSQSNGSHNIRVQLARQTVISANRFESTPDNLNQLKLHALDRNDGSIQNLSFPERDSIEIVVSENIFIDPPNSNASLGSIGPQNGVTGKDERVYNVIVERNRFLHTTGLKPTRNLHMWTSWGTVRNNVFDTDVWSFGRRASEPTPVGNQAYDNCVSTTPPSSCGSFFGGGTAPPPPLPPACGDGTCNGSETCSTCSQDCGVCPVPVCGNGSIESGEQCDDGNTTNGDGCNSSCQFEIGSAAPTNGLVSFWDFNEGSGTTTNDQANANTGTLVNGASWTSGQYGTGILFDGANDYVVVPHHATLDNTGDLTIAVWVNSFNSAPLNGLDQGVIKKGGCLEPGVQRLACPYEIEGRLSDWRFGHGDTNDTSVVRTNTGIQTNTWIHLAFVRNGSTGTWYINGQQVATQNMSGGSPATNNLAPVTIGAGFLGSTEYFEGLIDEVYMYDRALSVTEIQTIMSAVNGI